MILPEKKPMSVEERGDKGEQRGTAERELYHERSSGPSQRKPYRATARPRLKTGPYKRPAGRIAASPYKSRGENLIAGFLKEAGIKFLYEYPVIIIDDDNKIRVWYPDFWLPELSIVVEYFGMVNDEQYREQMKKKQDLYRKLDIDFIGLDTNMVQLDKNWEKFIVMRIMEIMDSKGPLYRRLEQLKRKYTWN